MHPMATYELARIRIEDLHAEAARERLAATAREARAALDRDGGRDHRRALQLGFAQPLSTLRRLLAKLTSDHGATAEVGAVSGA